MYAGPGAIACVKLVWSLSGCTCVMPCGVDASLVYQLQWLLQRSQNGSAGSVGSRKAVP